MTTYLTFEELCAAAKHGHDPRYDYRHCDDCGRDIQVIDFNGYPHRILCPEGGAK